MAAIVSTVEIARAPEAVFSYATDPSRFDEWQNGVVSGSTEGEPGVGGRCTMTRKVGGSVRTSTSEITEFEPPRRWAIHGVDGPIRADVSLTVEPVTADSSPRSRVTIQLEFHGHGFGKLIAPMVTGQARKEVPASCQKLKERLEGGA
jgi:uncharacterized protein YndB with AHSA1/START domain